MRFRAFLLPLFLLAVGSSSSSSALAEGPPRVDVLYIGDSHSVGVFGQTFDDELRSVPGTVVHTYASCGSREASWYDGWKTQCGYLERVPSGHGVAGVSGKTHATPLLSALLAAPIEDGYSRLVIVALGSNSVSAGEADKADIEKMAHDIRDSGATCVWVGPPRMRKFGEKAVDRYYEVLAEALHGPDGDLCRLLDSRKFTHYPAKSGDGIHYYFKGGPAVAKKWAEGVFIELEDDL